MTGDNFLAVAGFDRGQAFPQVVENFSDIVEAFIIHG